MTWAVQLPFTPMVDRYKWLETRHMVNISDRWNRTKPATLQFPSSTAWAGELGECLGSNGINPRDAEATRRWPRWSASCALPGHPEWNLTIRCTTTASSRAAAAWQQTSGLSSTARLRLQSRQMSVPLTPGMRYFDLYHGTELKPEIEGNFTC